MLITWIMIKKTKEFNANEDFKVDMDAHEVDMDVMDPDEYEIASDEDGGTIPVFEDTSQHRPSGGGLSQANGPSGKPNARKLAANQCQITSYVQQQQQNYDGRPKITKINKNDKISEDASPEFFEEIKSVGDKKLPTIADHERMEVTLKDMMSNQFKNAEEYAYHIEQATNYMENQIF
ncbi:hypothetical protein Tco_0980202 [Tanacetum coccineum]